MVERIEKMFDSVRDLVISQHALFGESGEPASCLLKMVEAIVDSLQSAEDSIAVVANGFDLDSACGGWLDIIGGLLNTERRSGESDSAYRERLKVVARNNSAATADNIILTAADLSGDPAPQFLDEAPATFFVYTPDGSQLTRAQVQKLAPAGVLGLPGAALQTADGKFICTADGRRILAVAQDVG